ncbi:MAG: hypothetical protein ACOC1P_02330 [Minisyncoccales bacterium]
MKIKTTKKGNESSKNLVRRFSSQIKKSNILRKVRKKQYHERDLSEQMKKEEALRKKRKREKMRKLRKLGEL